MSKKIVCSQCNSVNDRENQFRVEYGTNLQNSKAQESIKLLTQQQQIRKDYTLEPKKEWSPKRQWEFILESYDQKPMEKWKTFFGIIGLIFGSFSLFVLSWLFWIDLNGIIFKVSFILILFGLIFSSISIGKNRTIGLTGLTTSIIAGIIQIINFFLWIEIMRSYF